MNLTNEKRILIFENKLKECFNLHILSNTEKKEFGILNDKNEYIPNFEQGVTRIINVYKVFGERVKKIWSSDFDEENENYNLLWLFDYEEIGIYRISLDCISERLENFVSETNSFFSGNNKDYTNKTF